MEILSELLRLDSQQRRGQAPEIHDNEPARISLWIKKDPHVASSKPAMGAD